MQAASVLNTFAEFVLTLMPLIAVFRLRVNPEQRWGIISLLSLGFMVVIVGW